MAAATGVVVILARYLIRNLVFATAASLLGLVVVLVAVHLAEQAGELSGDVGPWVALQVATFIGVEQFYQMLPLAGFFATLVTGAVLARRGELLAMGGSGVQPARLAAAFVTVLLGVAAVGWAWGELVAPPVAARLQYFFETELNKGPGRVNLFFQRPRQWFQIDDLILFLPQAARGEPPVFADPTVYRFEDGLVQELIRGATLRHGDGRWRLTQARIYPVGDRPSVSHEELPLALHASPRDLIDVTGNPRQMGSLAVWGLIDRRERAGFDTDAHRVELHSRFAHPLLGFFLFGVVAPWALSPERRRSIAVALGGGVAVVTLAVAIGQSFRVLALGQWIAPWLGAWGVHLCCLLSLPMVFFLHRRYGSFRGVG